MLNNEIISAYNQTRNCRDRELICYAPFKNMYFNTRGNPAACWLSFFYENSEGYPQKSIREIWFGQSFDKLRECIRKKDLSFKCGTCYQNFKDKNFINVLANAYDNDMPVKKYPVILELELGNNCNLECIMCKGILSSSVRQAREKDLELSIPYDSQFVEQLEEFIPHLEEVRFNGGEPFLIDIYYAIWAKIIKIKPSIKIVLATNGTILNDRIKNLLKQGNFHINFSFDSLLPERYEYIRKNAKFINTLANLKYYHKFCREQHRVLCLVVNPMRINWQEMPTFIKFANYLNIPIWFNTIVEPADLAVWNLDKEQLAVIYKHLSGYKFENRGKPWNFQQQHNLRIYNNLVEQQLKTWLLKSR